MSNSACSKLWTEDYHIPYNSNSKIENWKEELQESYKNKDSSKAAKLMEAIKKNSLEFRVPNNKVGAFLTQAGLCIQETDKAEKSLGDVSSGAVGASVGIGATAGSIFLALKLLPKFKFW